MTTPRHPAARAAASGAALLLATLLAAPLAAQRPRPATPGDTLPRDTLVRLEGMSVRAARPATTAGGASVLQVRPDSLRLAAAPTLEQVLRVLPFVRVRENSRGEAELSVRGSESRQVAVLVDGVPLSLGWDHRADPSLVPLTGAQSLVLVRGLSSVLHGPNVLGGVVEVGVASGPFPPEPPPALSLRAGVDQTGARSLAVLGGAAGGGAGAAPWRLRAGAGYRQRDGLPLAGGVADPGAADGLRGNSDLRHADGFLAVRYGGGAGRWLSFSGSAYRAERGVPAELHLQEPRYWRYPEAGRALAVLAAGSGQRRTPFGEGDLEASLGVDAGHTEIDSYASGAYDSVAGGERADERTLTLRLLGDHTLPARGELRGALTLAEVRREERLLPQEERFRYRQRLWSLAGELAWPVPAWGGAEGGRVSGGLALDGADTPESGDKPALGRLSAWGGRLGANLLLGDGSTLLHAAVSRRARFPSLRELYSGALGRFAPNPGLKPERLWAAEAGMTRHAGALELQAVAFHHRLQDAIVRVSTGDGRFRRENRDELRSTGLELLGGLPLGAHTLRGELTLQRVRVLDPSLTEGRRRAEYQPALAAGVEAELALPLALRAGAGLRYTGRQWCVHPEQEREVALSPSRRLDLRAERGWRLSAGPFARSLRALLALDNAADAALYDQCGLPQPGRTLRLQLEVG